MKRRGFVTLLGGAAAWPLSARAQQAMPAIGFLASQLPDAITDRLRGFRRGLKDTGYVEGENVSIVYRFAENQDEQLPALAAELVSRRVAVIATAGATPTFAAKTATTTNPVVFLVGDDPASRPGGNITGINILTSELAGKRLPEKKCPFWSFPRSSPWPRNFIARLGLRSGSPGAPNQGTAMSHASYQA
jgi:putative tryptophan/tyrosine transport system substrate-binding protein